jgi:hypothetical protein
MDNWALSFILSRWEGFGLKPTVERKGKMVWKDCCIPSLGGASAPCDWLEYSEKNSTVWLKGAGPGRVMYGTNYAEAYMERIICQEEERLRGASSLPCA